MPQLPLDYQRPVSSPQGPSIVRACVGTAIGIAVTVPAALTAMISGGAGHGDYVAARALFPLPFLLMAFTHGALGDVLLLPVLLQYPLYGLIIGGNRGRRMLVALLIVAVLHLIAVAASFSVN